MIRINLLPLKETAAAVGRRQQLSLAALGLSVALLIMVVPYVYQGRQIASLEQQIQDTKEQIRRYNQQVKEVNDLDHLKVELQTKLRIIEVLNEKRVGPARVLDDLSQSAPDNLWLMDFNENAGAATLSGMALDNETIARFMRQLQGSPYFYGVDLVETSIRTTQVPAAGKTEAVPFTRFIIKANVDYVGNDGNPSTDGASPNGALQAGAAKQEPKS
jgi:type IV pilus assembly protein PilN